MVSTLLSICLSLTQSRLAVHDLLSKSWAANAEVTLKLIFCLRSIHDGKSEKNTFYHAFGWLYKHHPRTAIGNLPLLVAPIIDRPPKKAKKVEGEDRVDDWTEVEKEELQLPGYSHGKPTTNSSFSYSDDHLQRFSRLLQGFTEHSGARSDGGAR